MTDGPEPTTENKGASLPTVLAQTFAPDTDQDFATRFVGLIAALLNTPTVEIYRQDGEAVQRVSGTTKDTACPAEIAATVLQEADPQPRLIDGWLCCLIALPQTAQAALITRIPASNAMMQSLAYERIALLQSACQARFQNADLIALRHAINAASGLADPTPEAMQRFADTASALTGADYTALAKFDGGRIGHIAISGQSGVTTRATLPDKLRDDLQDALRTRIGNSTRHILAAPNADYGMVFETAPPARNAHMVPLLAGTILQATPARKARRNWVKTLRSWAVATLILVGVALIPLPDGLDIPATVRATNFRVVTSPLTAAVLEVRIAENQTVTGGQTVLVVLDTSEFDNELIAAQADYNTALLQRETARANRQAAALRNAELEAERMAARIAILEARRASAQIIAPIDGRVIGRDLLAKRGAVVRQGEDLLEIADPSHMRLDLDIAQRDLGRVQTDLTGPFRPDFDPTLRFDVTVTAISPAARDTDRVPVFAGEASLDGDTAQLRHGMTGIVSVDRTWRPAGQIVWRALRDWVLLRLWL